MAILPGTLGMPQSANPIPANPQAILGQQQPQQQGLIDPKIAMMLASILGGAQGGAQGVSQNMMGTMQFLQQAEQRAELNKIRQKQIEMQEKEEERREKQFEFDVSREERAIQMAEDARRARADFIKNFQTNGGMGARPAATGQQAGQPRPATGGQMSPQAFMTQMGQIPGMGEDAIKNLAKLKMEQATNRPQTMYQGHNAQQVMIDPMTGQQQVMGQGPRFSPQAMMHPGLKSEAEKVGSVYGGQFEGYLNAGQSGREMTMKLDRYEQLLDQVDTGAFATPRKAISRVFNFLGVDPGSMGIGDLGSAEAMDALRTQLATVFIGDTKGAVSDAEMRMFLDSVGGLATSKQGNKLIVETLRKIADRKKDVANLAERYRGRMGSIQGFGEVLDEYNRQNPLFDSELQQKYQQIEAKASRPAAQEVAEEAPPEELSNMSDEELLEALQGLQ